MPDEVTINKCPKFDFTFRKKCPCNGCMLWHSSESEERTNCLQIDLGVVDGLTYTQAKNSKLLMQLSLSDDPKLQLETSQILLQLAMVLTLAISQHEAVDYELCECGARKASCSRNGSCKARREWFAWLEKLFLPIVRLNPRLRRAELNHIFIVTLLQFYKTSKLPPFLEQAMPNLSLSKRII